MLVAVLAGLIEQDHLVDMGGAEPAQFFGDGFGRSDQAAAQRRLLGLRIFAFPLVVFVPHVDGAGRRTLPVLRGAVKAQPELEDVAPSARARASSSVFAHMKNDTSAMFGLIS